MNIEDNEQAKATMNSILKSADNRFRAVYNYGYKDGYEQGIKEAAEKIKEQIMEHFCSDGERR